MRLNVSKHGVTLGVNCNVCVFLLPRIFQLSLYSTKKKYYTIMGFKQVFTITITFPATLTVSAVTEKIQETRELISSLKMSHQHSNKDLSHLW